jgi:Protein tyrosine and serine/threonine kinase
LLPRGLLCATTPCLQKSKRTGRYSATGKQMFRTEADLLLSLDHPNIIRILGTTTNETGIILKLANHGDLQTFIRCGVLTDGQPWTLNPVPGAGVPLHQPFLIHPWAV